MMRPRRPFLTLSLLLAVSAPFGCGAVEAQGIVPDVISTADQTDGAPPLVHSDCTVIKVNGG